MGDVMKRKGKQANVFDRFDRMFEDWARVGPFRRPFFGLDWTQDNLIRIDEYRERNELVIQAEVPGIDPDKDVDLTVSDGVLRIAVEHREEEETEEKGYLRRELRSGSFTRTLPLPDGVSETDIKASYKDGILTIRLPMPAPEEEQKEDVKKITVTRG